MTIDEHESGEGKKEASLWERAQGETRRRREKIAEIEAKADIPGQMARLAGVHLPSMAAWERMGAYGKYELAIGLGVAPACVTEEIRRRGAA